MGRDLIIGNPPITVDLRRSARARRLSLRVSRLDGKVTLTMPPRAPEREALAFLMEREDWLRGHLSDVTPTVGVFEAQEVLYQGQLLRIETAPGRRIAVQNDRLLLPAAAGPASVKAFLRTRARDALVAASDRHAARIGCRYSRLTLRDTRSRWGSCSSAGALMYSWRLIMAPPEVLDYVAAHEVAHLAEMNHSAAFWAVVANLMPDYAARRLWLREEGDRLHRLRFDD
ncbi:M48 family metallopeptidase [Loktanella sp. DJP18]|uniref:M48 family metallopeptidase n=1 Tax=Loktanella sp. DJP18 TaxID=3409788 RepID=UPI003BB4F579